MLHYHCRSANHKSHSGRKCFGEPFKLRRGLQKLNFLPLNIKILVAFANSHWLRPMLQYTMSIARVPGQTRTVTLPVSKDELPSASRNKTEQHYKWGVTEAKALMRSFQPVMECPIHCECSLVHFLHVPSSTSWDNLPPLDYIGVSKLSCSA